jgi:hypothetical protein
MKKLITIFGVILFASTILTSCHSEPKNESAKENVIKNESAKENVIGEWTASGNGIKTKYIFNSDGSYRCLTEILGDFSSDEGTWEISGSNIYMQTVNGISNSATFADDYQSFQANNMTYSK